MDMFLGLPRKLATLPNKLRQGISRLQVDIGSTGDAVGRYKLKAEERIGAG